MKVVVTMGPCLCGKCGDTLPREIHIRADNTVNDKTNIIGLLRLLQTVGEAAGFEIERVNAGAVPSAEVEAEMVIPEFLIVDDLRK